jgi:hypothetical protein
MSSSCARRPVLRKSNRSFSLMAVPPQWTECLRPKRPISGRNYTSMTPTIRCWTFFRKTSGLKVSGYLASRRLQASSSQGSSSSLGDALQRRKSSHRTCYAQPRASPTQRTRCNPRLAHPPGEISCTSSTHDISANCRRSRLQSSCCAAVLVNFVGPISTSASSTIVTDSVNSDDRI